MYQSLAVAGLTLAAGAFAQQAGNKTAEVHPKLTTQSCDSSGCTDQDNTITLDANWRWVHNAMGTNCYTGNTWSASDCPDPKTCAENCYLDGAMYESTYGITTSGNALTLDFVTGNNVGSRTYLMDTSDKGYQVFKLKNREFTFDVDVSTLPCGLNGALYFSMMPADGGIGVGDNNAGAEFGTGYCDAQCPQDLKFINGVANTDGWTPSSNNANTGTGNTGACCVEMDIWEANQISAAYTPHPCGDITGLTTCDSPADCGAGDGNRYTGVCDRDGCDYNSFRMGNQSFYGPSMIVDTASKFTVVTQFITSDNTDTGDLSQIKRFYVQNGAVVPNSETNFDGIDPVNYISDDFCTQQKTLFGDTNSFSTKGGLKAMGDAFETGMVLVMSLWDDYSVDMLWLDSDYPTTADPTTPGVARGTCATTSGDPKTVEGQSGSAAVTYSNIKFGTIGSTFASS